MARVLVPFDDSVPARAALEYAFDLFPEGRFVALTVADSSAVPSLPNAAADEADDRVESVLAEATDRLEVAERIANDHDAPLETRARVGSPATEIVDAVESGDVDHVVIGSRGRSGVERLVLGSVAEVVVRHSPVPVTVVP